MATLPQAPMGFIPTEHFLGVPLTQKMRAYTIDPTASTGTPAVFTGDPVVIADGGTNGVGAAGNIAPLNANCVTNNVPMLGVFAGCQYQTTVSQGSAVTVINSPYWPGPGTNILPGSTVTAFVYDDPFTVYTVQCNVAATGIAATSLFFISPINIAAGNTATGNSGYSIGTPTAAGTSTNPSAKIIGFPNAPQGNAPGVGYNWVNVTLNNTVQIPWQRAVI